MEKEILKLENVSYRYADEVSDYYALKDINYTFELGTLDLGALTSAEHTTISINNNRGSILNNNTVYTTLEHRVDPRVTSIGTSANSRWAAEETSITSRSNVSTNNSDRFDTFF